MFTVTVVFDVVNANLSHIFISFLVVEKTEKTPEQVYCESNYDYKDGCKGKEQGTHATPQDRKYTWRFSWAKKAISDKEVKVSQQKITMKIHLFWALWDNLCMSRMFHNT